MRVAAQSRGGGGGLVVGWCELGTKVMPPIENQSRNLPSLTCYYNRVIDYIIELILRSI